MELTPKQQTLELINKAKRILVVPGRPDGDSLGSAMALHSVFKKLNKQVETVVLEPISDRLLFLPDLHELKKDFKSIQDFIITLNCTKAAADKLSYNFAEDKLNIIITPKSGEFSETDISSSLGKFRYDAIIVLDAADFDQIGRLYEDNIKLFQSVPVINIDHHASNDYFGTINLVDLTATSTAEILVGLIEALGPSLIDEDVATSLLAGIINDTGSFQHSNTTPKSLTIAAQMVGFGARQQEIIKYFFKTKQLSTLKLWGRILSRLQHDPEAKIAWSSISLKDFKESDASPNHTGGIIDELMTSVPNANVVVLLSEREPKTIFGSIRTKKGVDSAEIAKIFGGGGHHGAAGFKLLDIDPAKVESMVISKIREYQNQKETAFASSSEPKDAFTVASDAQQSPLDKS